MNYYSLLTETGKALEAAALQGQGPVILSHFVIGDGNGQAVIPDAARTTLVREVWRGQISALTISPDQDNQLIARLVIPQDTGGFVIREAGLLTEGGELFAIGNCAAIEKPAQGVSVNMNFRLVVSERAEVTLLAATGDGLFLRQDADLSDVSDIPQARKNLQLGSMALQDAGEVSIRGGEIHTTKRLIAGDGLTVLGSDYLLREGISKDIAGGRNITRGLLLAGNGDQLASLEFTEQIGQYAGLSVRVVSGGNEGNFMMRNNGELHASVAFVIGDMRLVWDGNIYGSCWGGWLHEYLHNVFSKRSSAALGEFGWWRCGDTGLIKQWGWIDRDGWNVRRVNFPVAFPRACVGVLMTQTYARSSTNSMSNISATERDRFGFNANIYQEERTADWEAYGY